MKTLALLRSRRVFRVIGAPLLLMVALVLNGCATRKQVADIVSQSNATMLSAQFGGLPEPGIGTKAPPWQADYERIETFIAAHPNQGATTAPLRIRQAMLLLSYHQLNLAEAAFNAVALNDLHTDRDQALKRSQATLVWWFGASTNDLWLPADQTRAQAALQQLRTEQSLLSGSPDIRDYLAEMRVWIGLTAAQHTGSTNRARALVEESLDVYAEVFTPEDLVLLVSGGEQLPDARAVGADVRRRLRARAVIAQAAKLNKNEGLGAHPKNVTFDKLIQP